MNPKNKEKQERTKYVSGPGGVCKCPVCETTKARSEKILCTEEICPNCGAKMILER